MTWLVRLSVLFSAALFASAAQPQPSATEADSAQEFSVPEPEKPFWENAKKFLNAYAARDAQTIGEMFTEDAEFLDEFGEVTRGRENIVALYESVFENSPDAALVEINLERVRYITDSVALEEGESVAQDTPGGPKFSSRYVVLHLKGDDGVWRINTLKDFPRKPGDRNEQLDQLEFLVGEWVSEEPGSIVKTTCRWSEDGNYLLRDYELELEGYRAMSGTQRIGWDPLRRQLRSWVFDSEGGYAEGYWTQNENHWVVTANGFTSEGDAVQATTRYQVVSDHRITREIVSLVIGRDIQPAGKPVTLTRKPPAPAETAAK